MKIVWTFSRLPQAPPSPAQGPVFSNSGMYTGYQEFHRVGVFGMKNFYYNYNCFCLLCTTYHKHQENPSE